MTRSDQRITSSAEGTAAARSGRAAALRLEYLREILAGNRKSALELVLDAYRSGCSIPRIYVEVLQEALYEVGRLWETNEITVADEHRGTAITQFVMANLYQHLEIKDVLLGKAVVTGVQGELHQVGANMVSDVLEADGWDVVFLGTDVPPDGVLQSIRQHGADIFGISSTMLFNLPKVIQLVDMVKSEFGAAAPRILLGGGAFKVAVQLPAELDGCAIALDLLQARDLARPAPQ